MWKGRHVGLFGRRTTHPARKVLAEARLRSCGIECVASPGSMSDPAIRRQPHTGSGHRVHIHDRKRYLIQIHLGCLLRRKRESSDLTRKRRGAWRSLLILCNGFVWNSPHVTCQKCP